MDITDEQRVDHEVLRFRGCFVVEGHGLVRGLLYLGSVFGLLFCCSTQVVAFEWSIKPGLGLREIYTDNVGLSSIGGGGFGGLQVGGAKDDAFITEISPSVVANAQGARLRYDLAYRLQALYYVDTNVGNQYNNQLQFGSNSELIEDEVFIDSTSTIGQVNQNVAGRVALDNISRTGTVSEFRTFSISPYWQPHFGNYASGELRFRYSRVSADNQNSNLQLVNSLNNLSDSSDIQENISLVSGPRFGLWSWRVNYFNSERMLGNGSAFGNDTKFQNYSAEVSYNITDEWRVFAQAGEFRNSFGGQVNSVANARNGSFLTGGLGWRPSPKLEAVVGYGANNRFITLNWTPSQRTRLNATFRDSQVGGAFGAQSGSFSPGGFTGGLGGTAAGFQSIGGGNSTGFNAGQTWNFSLQHDSKRTRWLASYFVDTTTIQQLLLGQPTLGDGTRPLPLPGQVNAFPLPFTDAVVTQNRAQLSVTYTLTKNTFNISVFDGDQRFQSANTGQAIPNQHVTGATASWNWAFGSRTDSVLTANWQQVESERTAAAFGFGLKNDLKSLSLIINRTVSEHLRGALELRHLQQESDTTAFDFDENRVAASLNMQF